MSNPTLHDGFERFHAPIGQFAIWFAALEKTMNWSIWVFLQCTEGQWHAIIDQIQSFQNRLYLFQTLARLKTKNKAVRTEIAEIVRDLGKANTHRNSILHGAWGGISLPDLEHRAQKLRYKAKGKLTVSHIGYTPTEIADLAYEYAKLTARLSKFMKQFDPGLSP